VIKKTFIATILLLGLFIVLSNYVKPYVVIYNKSEGVLRLYHSTGVKDVEPDIEQAEKAMKPLSIDAGGYEKVVLSWEDVKLVDGQLYLGWKFESSKNSRFKRGDGVVFNIMPNFGACSYEVYIENERDVIKALNDGFCLGKLNYSGSK